MSSTPVAEVCLSALFLVVGLALSLRFGTAAETRTDRALRGAHLTMCLWMAAMPWPAMMRVPSVLTLLVFSALALGIVAVVMFGPSRATRHSTPWLGYHAAMMATMAWTAALMAAAPMSTGSHDHAGAGPAAGLWSLPAWMWMVTVVLAVAFAVAAVHWLVRLAGPSATHPQHVADVLAEIGMAAGMSAGLLLMG